MDDTYESFFTAKIQSPKMGTIIRIKVGSYLVVDDNGNGMRIEYDSKKHSQLKVGDAIDISQ